MKRHLLLCAAATIALLTVPLAPARAALPVVDFEAIAQLLESVGIEGQQLTELIATYNEVVQVYSMATNIWGAVEKVVGADQWAPGLTDAAIRNPLPFAASQHPAWVGGFNDPSAIPFGSQYMNQNTVGGDASIYNDGSFVGSEILKATRALSSMQALASNHVQAIETRINALNDLFAQLGNIGKIQETESLSARLHTESNYANSQVVQAQQVMNAAQMQIAVTENNQRQWMYQDEANGIKAACGSMRSAASFLVISACK
jgi:type IV secretion system protein VirB5